MGISSILCIDLFLFYLIFVNCLNVRFVCYLFLFYVRLFVFVFMVFAFVFMLFVFDIYFIFLCISFYIACLSIGFFYIIWCLLTQRTFVNFNHTPPHTGIFPSYSNEPQRGNILISIPVFGKMEANGSIRHSHQIMWTNTVPKSGNGCWREDA